MNAHYGTDLSFLDNNSLEPIDWVDEFYKEKEEEEMRQNELNVTPNDFEKGQPNQQVNDILNKSNLELKLDLEKFNEIHTRFTNGATMAFNGMKCGIHDFITGFNSNSIEIREVVNSILKRYWDLRSVIENGVPIPISKDILAIEQQKIDYLNNELQRKEKLYTSGTNFLERKHKAEFAKLNNEKEKLVTKTNELDKANSKLSEENLELRQQVKKIKHESDRKTKIIKGLLIGVIKKE